MSIVCSALATLPMSPTSSRILHCEAAMTKSENGHFPRPLNMNPSWCNCLVPFGGCGACDVCMRRVPEWDPRVIRDTIFTYLEIRPHLQLWCGGSACGICVLCRESTLIPAARAAGIVIVCDGCKSQSIIHLFECQNVGDWRSAKYTLFKQ